MKILITRPIDEAIFLADKLKLLGYSPIISPLLKIEFCCDLNLQNLSQYEALIISSKNAIKAIIEADKNVKLLIVGKETTAFARSLGFCNSIYMGENIAELKNKLSAYNKLLYLSGEDITDTLSNIGSDIDRKIVYKAKAVISLPPEFIDFIKQDQLRACLFFSARTARLFVEFIKKYALESYCSNIIALTLSTKIAHNLDCINFKSCYVSSESTLESLVKLISKICK